ncbi:OPT oligopeptide transporter protein-domain-containing protein [Lasiosphaeria miniovina]|uniref:OPT oligopeptide transporter protein-domain-containing protein n=1 Tax=Lasiosphaeria miniovina TaxID=1954250 RepID=A0AA40DRC2_9PEZI|nr:OPT oligopeptide transporter protein-domain-containing protein [Lasiosphaeria miniovina]KAK0713329.1 OPT oligopeptide transporter protein-domain-containing protein [Lasiosphaeria miniovina]
MSSTSSGENAQPLRGRTLSRAKKGTDGPRVKENNIGAGIIGGNEAAVDSADVEREFNVTPRDRQEAQETADRMTLDEVKELLTQVLKIHGSDPNFPYKILDKIEEFLENRDVFDRPHRHVQLINEMKLEAALITNNSPYAEVRCVVENYDDPSIPSSTIRAWIIGLFFSCVLAFVNQLFSIRQPPIAIGANVAQLCAYPMGKFLERILPDWGVTLWGVRHSLNPGRFSKKEHMLITIMATVASNVPYTNNIIWIQYLPQFFNQSYAGRFSYQILVALSTNLIGYGMAGLTRRFLVYPAYCVWPSSLVTIALNTAFHNDMNYSVYGPGSVSYFMSRYKFFMCAAGAMFVWFWFPNYIFTALTAFSWLTWIAPNNVNLAAMTGFYSGLGINPWPTFDWNVLSFDGDDPLMLPFFATLNKVLGMVVSCLVIIGMWYSNAYFTSYLPINTNHVYDNTGAPYQVSKALDDKGLYDAAKYGQYSPAYLSAGTLTVYFFFFAVYPASIAYVFLHHRYELISGFKNLIGSFRKSKKSSGAARFTDVHARLMSRYTEVPEWWYLLVLAAAIGFGIGGIVGWETYTTPGVVFYGIVLCIIFVIPLGIIRAITGIEVALNVLAEFIGGTFSNGNALAMNYFKCFGYVTCSNATSFANDLKLAHYIKIPPRQTFMAQVIPTLISTFICVTVLNFQMTQIPHVCTKDAPNNMSCPGINTFFMASVLWGTIGPRKMFGHNGQYTVLMAGWALGVVFPVAFWFVRRRFKSHKWLRQVHPVVLFYGALNWSPYNLSWMLPSLPIAYLSWMWCKYRYLEFWAKYNFVLSAAFSVGISLAAVVMFFTVEWFEVDINWWGNTVAYQGCEADPCPLKVLGDDEAYFGPGQWLT